MRGELGGERVDALCLILFDEAFEMRGEFLIEASARLLLAEDSEKPCCEKTEPGHAMLAFR